MSSIKLKGDTSGEILLDAPAVAGTNTLTLPAETGTLVTQNSLVGSNLIINGDMRIAQRGTSATGLTNGDTGYHTCDRWKFVEGGTITSVFTMSQSTDVPTGQGFATSLKLDCTTAQTSLDANNQLNIQQKIEAQNLQHIKYGTSNAESLTLSFWVKSSKTGTYTFWLYQEDGLRSISNTFTIDTTDTWEKKTITILGDTLGTINNDNESGFWCAFYLNAGTNFTSGTFASSWEANVNANRVSSSNVNFADSTSNYINITGVKLEVGDTATPFEHLQYTTQLQLCQRYYTNITGSAVSIVNCAAWSATTMFGIYQYPTTMRAVPTMTYSALADFDCYMNGAARTPTQFLSEYGDENATRLKMEITGGVLGQAGWYAIDSSGGTLEFSAEL